VLDDIDLDVLQQDPELSSHFARGHSGTTRSHGSRSHDARSHAARSHTTRSQSKSRSHTTRSHSHGMASQSHSHHSHGTGTGRGGTDDDREDGADELRSRTTKSHRAKVDAADDDDREFEAEMVRLERRRAAKARDPRYRVEQRLEREQAARRQVGDLTMNRVTNVPMRRLEVHGSKGPETLELVDVKLLQARCRGLGNGCSVKTLLEAERNKEEQRKFARADPYNYRMPISRSLPTLSYEERLQSVQRRKLETYIGDVLNKMNEMRGEYPKDLPDSVERHLEMMQQDDFSWDECDY